MIDRKNSIHTQIRSSGRLSDFASPVQEVLPSGSWWKFVNESLASSSRGWDVQRVSLCCVSQPDGSGGSAVKSERINTNCMRENFYCSQLNKLWRWEMLMNSFLAVAPCKQEEAIKMCACAVQCEV